MRNAKRYTTQTFTPRGPRRRPSSAVTNSARADHLCGLRIVENKLAHVWWHRDN